jgi:hypothetical protein
MLAERRLFATVLLLTALLNANLPILPRQYLELCSRVSLQIHVKERPDIVRRNRKAATPIQAQDTHPAHRPEHHSSSAVQLDTKSRQQPPVLHQEGAQARP